MQLDRSEPKPCRIALYSHDTMGLGHLRRNLVLASSVIGMDVPTEVLMISGRVELGAFDLPAGVDFVTVPGLSKIDRSYAPRSLSGPLDHVIALRSAIIRSALVEYAPDVLVVDKVPLGVDRELEPALRALRATGTRCVLGLRDILDEPSVTMAEWRADRFDETLEHFYDEVWWYGDASVFDPVDEYHLSGIARERSVVTGYLATGRPRTESGLDALITEPFALCLVGGGQDGLELAEAFAHAPRPSGQHGIIVSGPFMPAEHRSRLETIRDVHVVELVPGCDDLIARAHAVVTMGGYNTVCEILAAGVRPLVVPRVWPRREQLVRAERFARADAIDMCHPDALTPHALGTWMAGPRPRLPPGHRIDLTGLARIPELAARLLARPPASSGTAPRRESARPREGARHART